MPGSVSDSYDPVFSTAAERERWVECTRAAARRIAKRFKVAVDLEELAEVMAEAAINRWLEERIEADEDGIAWRGPKEAL